MSSMLKTDKKKRIAVAHPIIINQNHNLEKNLKDGLNRVVKNYSNSKTHENNKLKRRPATSDSATQRSCKVKSTINPNALKGNGSAATDSKMRNFKAVMEKFNEFPLILEEKISTRNRTPVNVIYENLNSNIRPKSEPRRVPKKIKIPDNSESSLPCTNDLCSKVRQLARINFDAKRVKSKVSQVIMESVKDYKTNLHARQIEAGNRYSKRNLKSLLNRRQKYTYDNESEKNTTTKKYSPPYRAKTSDSDTFSDTESVRFETPDEFYHNQNFRIREWEEQYYDFKNKNNTCHELEMTIPSNSSSPYFDIISDNSSYDDLDEPNIVKLPKQKTSSANMLIHFRELLNQYDLEKLSNSNSRTFLSEDDVHLLRRLIEADEKYRYLKQKDRRLLKEMLLVQHCEIQAKERVLEQTLRNLRKEFENNKKPVKSNFVEKFNKIKHEIHTKHPKRSFSSGDTSAILKRNKCTIHSSHNFKNRLERTEETVETSSQSILRNQINQSKFKGTGQIAPANSLENMKEIKVTVERKTSKSLVKEINKENEISANMENSSEIIPPPVIDDATPTPSVHSIIPYPSLSEITLKSIESSTDRMSTSDRPKMPMLNLESIATQQHETKMTEVNEKSKPGVEVIFKNVTSTEQEVRILKAISTRLEKSVVKRKLRISRSLDNNFPISKVSKTIQTEYYENPKTIYSSINICDLLKKSENLNSSPKIEEIIGDGSSVEHNTTSCTIQSSSASASQSNDLESSYRLHYLSIEALKIAGDVLIRNPDSEKFELKTTNFKELRLNPELLFKILQPIAPECNKSVKIITINCDCDIEDEFKYEQMNPWKSKSPYNIPIKKDSHLKQMAINMLMKSIKSDSIKLKDLSEYQLAEMIDTKILTTKKSKAKQNYRYPIHRRLLFQIIPIISILIFLFIFLLPEIHCNI